MDNIGRRAAQAIEERVEANGSTLTEELDALGLSRKIKDDWKKRNRSPCAYWLQQLALAGYDVVWILTGYRPAAKRLIDAMALVTKISSRITPMLSSGTPQDIYNVVLECIAEAPTMEAA